MIITLFLISIIGGFLSGFLGLGGSVVIIPLLLTIPPLVNAGSLSMKTVSGLSMIQVLFASASAIIIHKRNNFINYQSLFYIGIPMALFSFIGSYFSNYLSNRTILIIFAIIVITAFIMLLLKNRAKNNNQTNKANPNKILSIIIGIVIGTISGIVGAGGGFILIPIMTNILKIPFKITIGTSLGVVFIGAIFGSIGKIISLDIDLILLFPIITGSLLASRVGAKVNKMVSENTLRYALLSVIIISFIQIAIKII